MPINQGTDSKGSFIRWGHLHKYYFKPGNAISKAKALASAKRQAAAVKLSQSKKK